MKLHLIIILSLALTSLSFGQTQSASSTPTQSTVNDDQPIKVNTLLVNIPVIASDRNGRYISGLTKDDFTILQDGEKQQIEFFADEKAPMNVAILIDTSGTTLPFLGDIQSAARDFVKIFRLEDQGMVAVFTYRMSILSKFTSNQEQLLKAIDKTSKFSGSGSYMQDAIYRLVKKDFASIKGRKAIIVLTDGLVAGNIYNEKLLSMLSESDVLVYPILFKQGFQKFKNVITKKFIKDQIQLMNSIADVTGGRLYINDSSDFKKIFQSIADELKIQYLIGFYPQNLDDGKDHKISIGVNRKDIVIRTKQIIQLKPAN